MCTTSKKHTKRRETLGNVNQNKTTRRAGYKVSNPPTPTTKHSELKEPYEMLNKAKPLSNNSSWADEGQSKSPKMKHSDQKGALQKPL